MKKFCTQIITYIIPQKEVILLSGDITIKKSTTGNLIMTVVIAVAVSAFLGGYIAGTTQTPNTPNNDVSEKLDQIISKIDSKPQTPQVIQQPQQQPQQVIIKEVSLDDDPWKGNQDAPITIVEFSDFQCPFCSKFFRETLSQIEANYVDTGKVKFVYRDLPLEGIHPNALIAHIAAECADKEGKFWDYHDALFEKQAEWQRLASTEINVKLTEYATAMGLDDSDFESCLKDQSVAKEVRDDALDAGKYGATGTPTFFIGNEKIGFTKLVGAQPYSSFQLTIDPKLG
jgi:protein-disulfide isomerase